MINKNCGNCKNCDKVNVGQPGEFWVCELYGLHHGYSAPVNVSPPYDDGCDEWSDTVRVDMDDEITKYY